jgi:ribosomal protein S18 acetylase RimI-like enzyme
VTALDAADGERFARVICLGFGMPLESPLPGWFAGLPAQAEAGFTVYGAWQGETLVAAASLFAANGVGTLAGAGTLPEYRGLGAQSALMARRMREAAALGCRLVTAETGTETPEKPNPSLHNMRRIGLTELYERRNWIWQPTTD